MTANLPRDLLAQACASTGKGLTETIVAGLELVKRSQALTKAKRLQGKLRLRVDIDRSRERPRR